ncbi:DNA repair protein RecN [Glaciecola sp. 1036]|uniref:DNA repair protein RecN n=1 Tax=Alteromonadaceae TaxID=72275 RepID=UPI003D06C66B
MLAHLDIRNLTVVKKVSLAVQHGMTAITGETGAGKSIALDALGLCLGQRAESSIVRQGAEKAEVIAHFDVSKMPKAKHWLIENSLEQEDNLDECFVRRVVSNEGRSKAFVNGIPVNLQQLKSLGNYLVNIHGQHDHHAFLKSEHQLNLLDSYADHKALMDAVNTEYVEYKKLSKQLSELRQAQQQRIDRCNLLEYQVRELDEFSLAEDEFAELEIEFKKLSSLQSLAETSDKVCYLLKDGEPASALDLLNHAAKEIQHHLETDPALTDSHELLQNALIQAQEAYREIDRYRDSLEADPERASEIEQRFSQCLDLARKHQVSPEDLYQTHLAMIEELEALTSEEASVESLEIQVQKCHSQYWQLSEKLSQSRAKAAANLSKELQASVRSLNMPHAQLNIKITFEKQAEPSKSGNDNIKFLISVNPGQAPDVLEKVVSGGELSRIGLAMQVIYSNHRQVPTLVFDEVDTGISGQTASVVGKLLKQLGENNQLICVTHLPQVAAQADNQIFVNKITDGKTTETQVLKLTKEERINEIARLLAGDQLTDTAIENAKDLLSIK